MSSVKLSQNQPLNKSSSPVGQRVSFNIPSQSHSISRISQITRNIHEPVQVQPRPQSTMNSQSRQLINLINISTEDPKNSNSALMNKSPLMKTSSFMQSKMENSSNRTFITESPRGQQHYSYKKGLNNQSELTINPEAPGNFVQEEIKYLKHPSPSYFSHYKAKAAKEMIDKGESSFQDKSIKSARPSANRESVDLSTSSQYSLNMVKKVNVRLSDQSKQRSDIKRSRNEMKEFSNSTMSPCKDMSSFQSQSSRNATLTNSILKKQLDKGKELVNKSSIDQRQINGHTKNQLSRQSVSSVGGVKPRNTEKQERQEGMDMKPLLTDQLGFSETKTVVNPNLQTPKRIQPSSDLTNYQSSPLRHVYNDLLDKKYGSGQKKNSIFSAVTGGSPKNEKKEKNTTTMENLYHDILDSIMSKTKSEVKKSQQDEIEPVEKLESNYSSNQEHVKSKSISLNIMNQVPRGVLVKRTDRKSFNNQFEQPSERRSEQKSRPKNQSAAFDLSKSFQLAKNFGSVLTRSPRPNENNRKESGFFTDRSKDRSSFIQSPEKEHVRHKNSKKSKSVIMLGHHSPVSNRENNTRKRSNAVINSPYTPRGGRFAASYERSLSSRPAYKEEKMDSKSLKVRKENKEFVDLINNISKNIQAPEIQELFGKEEELIVKDLIEFIQAQESSVEEEKSDNYEDRMSLLEMKIKYVKAQIPSLQGINLLGENDMSPGGKTTKTDFDNNGSLKSLKSSSTIMIDRQNSMKKSSFVAESTKHSKALKLNFGSVSFLDGKEAASGLISSTVIEEGLEVPYQEDTEPMTPKLGGAATDRSSKEEKNFSKTESAKKNVKIVEEQKGSDMWKKAQKVLEINNKSSSSAGKKLNKGLVIDIPVSETNSNAVTLESARQIDDKVPTESSVTHPQSQKHRAKAVTIDVKPKQSSLLQKLVPLQTETPRNEKKVIVPTLMPNCPPSVRNSPPSVKHSLQPPPQLNKSSNSGSFGNLPAHGEVERQTPSHNSNKLGALSNFVFKSPQPHAHPISNNHTTHEPAHNLSIATIVNLKKKLKPVYIEKLDPENLKETIYGEILDKEHPGVSFGDLHDLFENAPFKKPAPAAQPQQPQKKEIMCILPDSKRAQNISILAMKFRKLSFPDLREAIINLAPAILTSDTCSTLLPFCPLPEEIKACQNCKEPLEKLDTASQFMMHIYDIPQFGPRLRSTIFKHEFKERHDTILENINRVKMGCDTLKNNVHFKVFLRLSLEVANTLNEGTTRGSALGLKPASLLSFDTVRSNKPGLTLLVYMIQRIHEQKADILDFTDDFAAVGEATKVNIEDPIRGLQELKKDMNQIRLQLEISMERNPPDTGFFNAFKEFYDESSPLLVEAEEKANYAKSHYITTAKFLGEDDESLKRKTSIDFFKVFKHLGDTVAKFKTEEEAKKKREARRNAIKITK